MTTSYKDKRTTNDQSIQNKNIEKDKSVIKINVTRSMLSILNVLKNSGNYEKLETENEMIKQQYIKNTYNSRITCSKSSIYSTEKKE